MERLPPDYWMSILKNLHHKTPIQHCLCILLPLFLLKQLILHALYSDGLRQSMSGISCQRNFLSSFEKIMLKRCPFKMLVVYGLKVSHPMCFSMRQLLELNIKKIHLPSHAKTQTTQKLQLSGSSQLQWWVMGVIGHKKKKTCRGVFERRCRVMKPMTLDPLLKIEVQAHWYKNDTLPPFAACCTQRFLSLANCCSRPFSCAERQSRYFSYAGPDQIVRENQLSACITLHIGIAYLCLLACSAFFASRKEMGISSYIAA